MEAARDVKLPNFALLFLVTFSLFFWIPIFGYRKVGKVHNLGSGNENILNGLIGKLEDDGYRIKTRSKYSIEAYFPTNNILISKVHIVVYMFEEMIYASAWKYGAPGFAYNPFYFGLDRIEYFRKLTTANQASEVIGTGYACPDSSS